MRVNRRVRRFHDAWGIKCGGSVIISQWGLGNNGGLVDRYQTKIDSTKILDNVDAIFVYGQRSLEKMRQ